MKKINENFNPSGCKVGQRFRYTKKTSLGALRAKFAKHGYLITRETYKKDGADGPKAYRTIRITQRFR